MLAIRSFAALSLVALATACASPGATDATPAAGMSPGMSDSGTPMPMAMATMEPRMKAMKNMHQKMMAAKSPAERQAMMADHMASMQDGMSMMKEMHGGMQGMGGMTGMTGMTSMGDGKVMQAEMAKREQMMADHRAMMQMMMDMMAQRMPASPAPQ